MAGRSAERPASSTEVLLFSGRAEDGADCLATFDRKTVLLSRPVAGLACRIRLAVGQFDAVAVAPCGERHAVRLVHRDRGLSIDLIEFATCDAAEDYRDKLAGFLDLPSMTLGGSGSVWDEAMTGALSMARHHKMVRARKPRFLVRRQTGGNVIPFPSVRGREIIARN
jgi:hypothetical protein